MSGKVIHIVHWENSGIYSVANELAIEGKRHGHAHLIRVIRKGKKPSDFIVSIFRIIALVFEVFFSRGNIYHAHSFLPFLLLYFSFGQKAITFHNLYPYFSSSSQKDRLKRFLISTLIRQYRIKSSAVGIGVADAVKKSMGIPAQVIFNGLRPERYNFEISTARNIIGTAGRLDDQKNYAALIEAFAKCKSTTLILKIAGEGVKRKELEKIIASYSLNDRVHLLGHQHDMLAFYSSIDAFICSSIYEGCNLVVAESMFSGKPVISTNVGIALDFDNVSIIRSEFDVDALAVSIDKWIELTDQQIENDVINNRKIVVGAFSISNIYQQYFDSLWKGFAFNEH